MRVIVAGAGKLGRRVSQILNPDHTVVVIEQDEARADAIREELGCTVVNGDADEPYILLEAGIERADVLIAATGHDEDNLVASLLAKNEYKVKKVIAAVRNPRNRWLYNRSWGVDVAIDSAQIVASLIEEEAKLKDIVELLSLGEGEITVSAVTATAGGTLAGKAMSELRVPPGCNPAAILRGTEVVMPGADVHVEVGDVLLFVTSPGAECLLEELS
jgi:trk system potassium uptake protein TrkA